MKVFATNANKNPGNKNQEALERVAIPLYVNILHETETPRCKPLVNIFTRKR